MEVLDRARSEPFGSLDDGWSITETVTEDQRRSTETVMVVGGPVWAVRDLSVADAADSRSATFVAGCYDDTASLMALRPWTTRLTDETPPFERVRLDLHHAVVDREVVRHDGTRVAERRFVSAVDPSVGVQRIRLEQRPGSGDADVTHRRPGYAGPDRAETAVVKIDEERCTASIVVSHTESGPSSDGCREWCSVAGIATGTDTEEQVRRRVTAASELGPVELERRHRREWERRWSRAGTEFAGDRELERSVRFATMRLLELEVPEPTAEEPAGAVRPPELALGARGLTGTAYHGHVFWDTDLFALPALSSLAPATARRLLDYRWNRLDRARARARAEGRPGARFPWESATSGDEVTPTEMIGLDGRPLAILTGDLELHITADIAWAVWNHVNWSGDERYLATRGVELLVETARYWASRLEVDADGTAHVRDVIGPDEYHVHVDDNTFTNVMIRHNLQIAAHVADRFEAVERSERSRWGALADAIVDGFDPGTGRYEQFAGYFALGDVLAADIAPPPMSADALVGTDVIQRIQVIKQPDVMMAYHLVPHLMDESSFEANLDHYHPRTAHGSSLSPAINSSCLLRAGRFDEAVRWLRLAADLDLRDVTGTTAGGLHLATIGGVWQAVTFGLLGIRAREHDLLVDPAVPAELGRVVHRFGYRRRVVTATVDGDEATIEADGAIAVTAGDHTRRGRVHRIERNGGQWRWA